MEKRKQVLRYLLGVETATLEQIYENVSFSYYMNYKQHLGAIMTRLVRSGKVERIKPGVFRINYGRVEVERIGEQGKLFP